MVPTNWNCPYCGHAQVVTNSTFDSTDVFIPNHLSKYGKLGGQIRSIVCSNRDCKELTISFSLNAVIVDTRGNPVRIGNIHHSWQLLPESSAKPQPDYIPKPIVENYNQACRIRDLSPNASAAMSRRCLQGMIRDFCEISERTLAKEIDTLRRNIDEGKGPQGVNHDTIDAIDHVRSIGNIGAHMEKDINLIIDVESDEAQTLINLIELLFNEWYVAKHVREQRLKALGMVVDNKKIKKAQANHSPPPEDESSPHSP